jgi:hypothetical protein
MDKKKLVEILKRHGLTFAEDASTVIIKGVFNAIPDIIKETENKYDDLLLPLLEIVKPVLLELVDKIDKK